MARTASSKRYAQAVFGLALELGQLDQWSDTLRDMGQALTDADLRGFLEHAKVPVSQKVQAIDEIFPAADPLLRKVLSLLVSRSLLDLLPGVESDYQRLLDEFRGREHVEISSAVPLEDAERQRIAQFLEGLVKKQIVLDSRVDPSILGGLVIRVGDRLVDGSTRSKLAALGRRLQGGVEPAAPSVTN